MRKARPTGIKAAGKPLHINEILNVLKLEPNKKNRLSLSGSLSGYARRGEVFTRPAPNTFGLVEFHTQIPKTLEPPDGFGDEIEDEPDHDEPILDLEDITPPGEVSF